MTAKKYLSQYLQINQEINVLCAESIRLRSSAERVTSCLSAAPGSGGSTEAPFVRSIDKIIAIEEQINQKIDKLVIVRREIETVIDGVDNPTYRTLLRYRYICGMKWEAIADTMSRDLRWIYRLHGYALKKIDH